jgi:hypothetical protein
MSRDTYSVRISGMRYGGHELLRAKPVDGQTGPPPPGTAETAPFQLEGLFDTVCIDVFKCICVLESPLYSVTLEKVYKWAFLLEGRVKNYVGVALGGPL